MKRKGQRYAGEICDREARRGRLAFCGVSSEPGPDYDVPLWDVSFALDPGELLLVRLEMGHLYTPLADLALGLINPARGQVLFNGRSWAELPPERAARLRGRCRRTYLDGGWYTAQTLITNICLAQMHHSRRSLEEIEIEAAELSRAFGLPGLPLGRPDEARDDDLQRASLARAFLGRPQLMILEEPTQDLYPDILPPLLNSLARARSRGAAVIWTTADERIWEHPEIGADRRGCMYGSRLRIEEMR
ncbi:MAG: hypothetical protein Tsb0017_24760 [Geothermobacteraceae bacterium]